MGTPKMQGAGPFALLFHRLAPWFYLLGGTSFWGCGLCQRGPAVAGARRACLVGAGVACDREAAASTLRTGVSGCVPRCRSAERRGPTTRVAEARRIPVTASEPGARRGHAAHAHDFTAIAGAGRMAREPVNIVGIAFREFLDSAPRVVAEVEAPWVEGCDFLRPRADREPLVLPFDPVRPRIVFAGGHMTAPRSTDPHLPGRDPSEGVA